jgi:N-acetylneuraminate lyase
MKKIKKHEGLIAAPFTPMHKDGSLNLDIIDTYYNFLAKNKVIAAFINGSSGEGASLSSKEKQIYTEKWTRCYKDKKSVEIINLVGGTSYTECIENAIFSSETGVTAIALVPPYYFKPPDVKILAEFCALVGEAVPEMPVYYYHIPVLTGVNFPMISFLQEISIMLPNFAGIKFTHEDFMDYLTCLNFRERAYDILWGRDECMLSALVLGARGAVGSTYNYAAPLYYKIIKAFNENNLPEARMLQQKSIDMIRLLGKYGGMATGKSYMRLIGLDCGKFRVPVQNMTEKMYEEFSNDVRSLKMDELFSAL